MPQVENVFSSAGFSDAVVNAGFNRRRCSEEKTRVNISLHTNVLRQALQGFAYVDGPVERDDVYPCGCHSFKYTGTAGDVKDEWCVGVTLLDHIHHLFLIWRCEGVVISWAQLACP